MDRMFFMCQKIIELNTNIRDQETIDLIAASIMSIFIDRGKTTLDVIPEILQKTNIISDNRSVLEVEHQVINNYKEDKKLADSKACVTRLFSFDGDKCFEKRYLIAPKANIHNNPINTIEQIIHELIHLLRFQNAVRTGNKLVFKEGVSTKTIDLDKNTTYRKNYMLEETIVQIYTKKAMNSLFTYSDNIHNNPLFNKINLSKDTYQSKVYDVYVKLFDKFMDDPTFNSLVENTFKVASSNDLESYFNRIMDDNEAFTKLSHYFNKLNQFLEADDVDSAKKVIACILHQYNIFKSKTGIKK